MSLRARWSLVVAVLVGLVSGCDSGSPGPTPVSVVISAGDNQSATVGSVLSNLQIEVRDAEGVAIGGLTFAVAVQSGGGTYTGTVTKTVKGAPTPLGTWTLGTTAGVQSLRVTSGSLVATISATAVAGAPAAAEVGGAPGAPTTTTGGVGAIASITPSVRLRDSFGNAVVGRTLSVTVTGGGTVANPAPVTDATGLASVGVWTLGTVSGAQRVTITGSGLAPAVFTADVAPGPAAQLAVFNAPTPGLAVNSQISNIEFAVQDQFGNGVPLVPVTLSVLVGGGSITINGANTNAQGRVSPGTWRLGTVVGLNQLRATAPGFEQTVSVTTVPGPAASIAVVAGGSQTATVSTVLPIAPVFSLRDAFGNGIAGQAMQFDVVSGGGSLAAASATTAEGTGDASPGAWTLGATVGSQTIRATVGSLTALVTATTVAPGGGGGGGGGGAYRVEVRYVGTPPSAAVQAAFTAAAARIEAMITGDVAAISLNGFDYADQCGVTGAPVLTEVVDDLIIFASVAPIDGPGQILGQAGPCIIRTASKLPVLGDMVFDSADLDGMVAAGSIGNVILHEMLHVIGIGTIWGSDLLNLLSGAGSADPFFTGSAARTEYVALGGNPTFSGVPVENTGGSGTRDGHWRESLFGRELMTGFLNGGVANPLSRVSIAALGDLGYTVNLGAADAYTVSPALRASMGASALSAHSTLRYARFTMDAQGRIIQRRANRLPPTLEPDR